MGKFLLIWKAILFFFSGIRFPFICGHYYLSNENIESLETKISEDDENLRKEFELEFARKIGKGTAFSFASGRMAFFHLMQTLKITSESEVILLGFTCSVMVNAVLRIGAKIIFSDLDEKTFGSSIVSIKKLVNENTGMIVIQHNFGIPVDTEELSDYCAEKGIYLVEDCALTLNSEIRNIKVGRAGIASIYSLDHSKPINTIIGGVLYSENSELIQEMKKSIACIPELPEEKRKLIFKQIVFEKKYFHPERYHFVPILEIIQSLKNKVRRRKDQSPFLNDEYGTSLLSKYPYPARLPSFLCALGLIELKRFDDQSLEREKIKNRIIELFKKYNLTEFYPEIYSDSNRKIIPLRYIFTIKDTKRKKIFSRIIDPQQIWFTSPIVSTNESPHEFGYIQGSCPIAEKVESEIFNLPCVIHKNFIELFFQKLESEIKKIA